MTKGLIHVYVGDGKGKTTAAIGLAIRACGDGYKVIIAQFLKTRQTSELNILNTLNNICILRGDCPKGFYWELNDEQKKLTKSENQRIFYEAIEMITEDGKYLFVFDEIIDAINNEIIDEKLVIDYLRDKPSNIEIVMTGRNQSDAILELADYVSEINKIKHPYDKGVNARKGIEY